MNSKEAGSAVGSRWSIQDGLLTMVFVVSLFRFVLYLLGFIFNNLQMDFSTMYSAGDALNHGLSPYLNYADQNPGIWDGLASTRYSRWFYPPLAASLFQPFAMLPYFYAKLLWSLVIIISVCLSLYLTQRTLKVQLTYAGWMILATITLWFFPFFVALERGQIDCLCLLALSSGFYLISRQGRYEYLAGGMVAVATVLKLHCGLIGIFFLLRKKWKTSAGCVLGGAILFLLSVGLNGWEANVDYFKNQLPRISKDGPYDQMEQMLPRFREKEMERRHFIALYGTDFVAKPTGVERDGEKYSLASFKFYDIASFARVISLADAESEKRSFGVSSMIVLLFALLWVFYFEWRAGRFFQPLSATKEWIYWNVGLCVILVSAPLTWVTNEVWLLPQLILLAKLISRETSDGVFDGWMLIALGLIIAGLPDESAYVKYMPLQRMLYFFKPVIGPFLCLVGLFRLLSVDLGERGSNFESAKA